MSRPRIFVVEDDAIIRLDLEETLEQLGFEVAGSALSGLEALLEIERTSPDLVLMDIKLAGRLDGIATAAALRKRNDLALVYVTSHSDPATLARAAETAPDGYVVKPFAESDLCEAIATALAKRRQRQPTES